MKIFRKIGIIIGGLLILTGCNVNTNKRVEIARIGGIELHDDSITAVNAIKQHFNIDELEYNGDSIGYSTPDGNEKFYIKLCENKVVDILYYNPYLNSKDIDIVDRHNHKYIKSNRIHHIGETMVIDYDGQGTYHIMSKF